jgi:hypothetical protein
MLVFGRLDAAGNFIEDPKRPRHPLNAAFSGPHFELLNCEEEAGKPVYEYRSGRLVRGSFDGDRNFVPDLHSPAIEFKDYRYRPSGIRIYNLPGRFEKVEDGGARGR